MSASEPRIPDRRPGTLSTFRFRDFRLLWTGLLVSNLGTWMQFTALGYYVASIAPNAALGSLNGFNLVNSEMAAGAAHDGLFPRPLRRRVRGLPVPALLLNAILATALIALASKASATGVGGLGCSSTRRRSPSAPRSARTSASSGPDRPAW